ncbi:plasma membrane fusion protein PRM1 [Parathielavia appendiculata]|uniref:Plasma membrane fusion protein PRM1 n=1 Tax=Parathielavia appendiculata TaxID=2587402 RepID=A0AAN6U1Y9_9PEZI|nr:plasma membrane fusion protein PRM1 [Parathielavia appendiculata]
MFSNEKSGALPPVPSNLNIWHTLDLQDEPQSRSVPQLRPYTAPSVTPYLGLRARLSQLWFNRWTVLLILVLVRVLLVTDNLNGNIGDAKVKALSACTKVEDIGSAMASMPHYLSVGVNSLASDGITKTVAGMVHMLMMILTGVENLIFFIINMYVGTFVCLAVALIHGGLDVAVKVVEGATKVMNDAISTISGQMTDTIEDVQNAINDIPNKVTSLIGLGVDLPKIDISKNLDDLKNIKIDSNDLVKDLVSLNTTIPTFDQVENFTKNAIGIPFGFVKEQVNASFGSYKFEDSVFPVAKKQALSFCSQNSFLNDFFQTLFDIVAKAKIAFTVVIPILALVAIIVIGWLEIRRFRSEKTRAVEFTKRGYDPMDVVYLSSRPTTSRVGVWLSERWQVTERTRIFLRWMIAYGTSRPALFVLSLAIAGLFSCVCQLIILSSIKKEAPALASQVGDFAGDVVDTLQAVSTNWANDANGVIVKLQDDMNSDLFGWVSNATTAVNNTLNTFDAEIDKALTAVFKDTILMNTARNLVGCLITRKIDAVQKGLTWVHDNAHVTLPQFSNDIFAKGANDSVNGDSDLTSFLASPSSVTTDEITSAVNSVISKLEHGIIQEALISTALLLVYVIVVLIGVVWALVSAAQSDKTRAEGGEGYGMKDVPTRVLGSRSSHGSGAGTLRGDDYSSYGQDVAVVYAGSVRKGRPSPARWPSHARKSSHPEVDQDSDR